MRPLAFRRSLQYVRGMDHYRRIAHTRYDLKYHFVWITKYRKKPLRADVAVRLRQIVRDVCLELEVERTGISRSIRCDLGQPLSGL
jgi:Transposase IS200 like